MAMKIDGVSTSQHIDSSGEILNIAGHDISDLVEKKAVFNWEHDSKTPENILGQVIYAKKILKADDCSTDRERMYWKEVQKPFVYIIGELFDDEEHPGAVAAAAMMRYYHKRKEKLLTGFSIEGATLERDGSTLERSVGRRVAITLRPCNKTCIAGVMDDPGLADVVNKSMGTREIGLVEVDSIIFEDLIGDADPISSLKKAVEILQKTMAAGNYNVAPGQLVGGAALQVEDRSIKNRLRAAVRDWDKRRPLRDAIKAALPEVADDYIDHFTHVAEDISLKKGLPTKMSRVGASHSMHPFNDEDQNKLIEGIYLNKVSAGHEVKSHIKQGINDAGQSVMLKKQMNKSLGESPKHATVYHDIAKKIFGMGAHVPTTTHVQHPDLFEGEPTQAMEFHKDYSSPFINPEGYTKAIKAGRQNGDAHKLALMDHILGHDDRHVGNIMVDSNGKLVHIDNDSAFTYSPQASVHNAYAEDAGVSGWEGAQNDNLHIDALKWLNGLDAKTLGREMVKHDMNPEQIKQGVGRLKAAQHMATRGATIGQITKPYGSSDEVQVA